VKGDGLALGLGGGMAEAEVAHSPQSARQDVAQVSPDKLVTLDGLDALDSAMGPVFPAEAHMGVGERDDT